MKQIIVNVEQSNMRIDQLCASLCDHSRSKVAQMIKQGDILVNNEIVKPSYSVQEDDEILIKELTQEPLDLEPVEMDLDIIYEDEDLMVINKPQGLIVHPSNTSSEPTLVHGLLAYTNKLSQNDSFRPGIVHRIDKDTSGALVVAKNDVAHAFLSEQLKDKTMNRTYCLLVSGVFPHKSAKVDAPIGRDKKLRQHMTVTHENAKEAVTHFHLLETFENMSLLEAKLETGRTHQIRVHAQYMNYPVVGDNVYGFKRDMDPQGQYLHAKIIEFIHPKTKQLMRFEAPLPKRFEDKLKELRGDYEYKD